MGLAPAYPSLTFSIMSTNGRWYNHKLLEQTTSLQGSIGGSSPPDDSFPTKENGLGLSAAQTNYPIPVMTKCGPTTQLSNVYHPRRGAKGIGVMAKAL